MAQIFLDFFLIFHSTRTSSKQFSLLIARFDKRGRKCHPSGWICNKTDESGEKKRLQVMRYRERGFFCLPRRKVGGGKKTNSDWIMRLVAGDFEQIALCK